MLEDLGECLRLEQVDTFLGKCFTIATPCQVRQEEFLTIMANFERSSSSGGDGGGRDGSPLAFTLHHPGATLGLNANFYPGPVVTGTLRGDGMLDVKLRHPIPYKGVVKKRQELQLQQRSFVCRLFPANSVVAVERRQFDNITAFAQF